MKKTSSQILSRIERQEKRLPPEEDPFRSFCDLWTTEELLEAVGYFDDGEKFKKLVKRLCRKYGVSYNDVVEGKD